MSDSVSSNAGKDVVTSFISDLGAMKYPENLNDVFMYVDVSNPTEKCNEESDDCDQDECYKPEYEPEEIALSKDLVFEILSVVPPPLEYMSMLHTQNCEISGRQVWAGSVVLANVLWNQHISRYQRQEMNNKRPKSALFANQRILELGSGTGILGMAISKFHTIDYLPSESNDNQCSSTTTDRIASEKNKRRPSLVVLTDGDDKAIELISYNLQNPINHIDTSIVKTKQLKWWQQVKNDDSDTKSDEVTSNSSFRDNIVRNDFLQWVAQQQSETSSSNDFMALAKDISTNISTSSSNAIDIDSVIGLNSDSLLFDCIVAGDVLYKPELPKVFFDTAYSLLRTSLQSKLLNRNEITIENDEDGPCCHSDSTRESDGSCCACLWLCHVPRNNVTQQIVQHAATAAGFTYEIVSNTSSSISEYCENCPIEDVSRAVVYKMKKNTRPKHD